MKEAIIRFIGVTKTFGNHSIISDLHLDVDQGEFLTLLGPSGCGKTTTLRMLAGFEQPSAGEIWLNGQNVTGTPPNKRDVNTVFQQYALFPHMTVRENIAYGLKMRRVPASEMQTRVNEALRMVQMESYAERKPRQLSGGQQQRVAVARAIVNNPSVLLLDEPLGALDLKLRKQMQLELKHLQQRLGITFLYVTHDQEEALTMSDRIAVMRNGRIEQVDTPHRIYHQPRTRFVADFIGETNLLNARVQEVSADGVRVEVAGVSLIAPRPDDIVTSGSVVCLSVRPEAVRLMKTPPADGAIKGTVKEQFFVGSLIKTVVRLSDGTEMVAAQAQDAVVWQSGDDVWATWEKESGVVLVS